MCHTGGPRCYDDAKQALVNAQSAYEENPSPENKALLKEATLDVALTPEFIERKKTTNPDEAARLQKLYDHKLEGAKEYERYRKEAGRTLSRLEEELSPALEEIEGIDARVKGINSHLRYLEFDNENGGFTSDDEFADQRNRYYEELNGLDKRREELVDKTHAAQARMDTMFAANAVNLQRRKDGLPLQHSHLMPEKFAGYFADTERKHFNEGGPGSTFTEAKDLNEVLSLAAKQRKSLEGDDRDKLIARGADPSSFAEDKRYLMVETKGKLGTVLASELKDTDTVTVVQKNEKAKPLCVTEVDSKQDADFATIVLVDNPSLPGTEHHPTLLITSFPGASGPNGSNNDLLPYVGKSMTVAEARKIYGRDFTVNTQVKKSE